MATDLPPLSTLDLPQLLELLENGVEILRRRVTLVGPVPHWVRVRAQVYVRNISESLANLFRLVKRTPSAQPLDISRISPTQPQFGQWLRSRREAAGISAEELADRANLCLVTINNLEHTPRHLSKQTVIRLVDALESLAQERGKTL